MNQLTWHKIVPGLIKKHYVVLVDIRGYGIVLVKNGGKTILIIPLGQWVGILNL